MNLSTLLTEIKQAVQDALPSEWSLCEEPLPRDRGVSVSLLSFSARRASTVGLVADGVVQINIYKAFGEGYFDSLDLLLSITGLLAELDIPDARIGESVLTSTSSPTVVGDGSIPLRRMNLDFSFHLTLIEAV